MSFSEISVFIWFATLNHFVADFLTHRKKRGSFIFVHCSVYAALFVPLFYWLGINLLWLVFSFASHLVIDLNQGNLLKLVRFILQDEDKRDKIVVSYDYIVAALDHVLHLSAIGIVAFVILDKGNLGY